jgi:hypothetical protein
LPINGVHHQVSWVVSFGFEASRRRDHVFNLGVHIVCALLFFSLVVNILLAWAPVDWRSGAFGIAYWSALIWALHPLNTGAVTYISARSESLMKDWDGGPTGWFVEGI